MSLSLFDDLLTQADTSAQAGQWQQVLVTLTQASAMQPRHAGVLTGLGTAWLQLGQPAQALPYFKQAVEMEPASPEAHNNLGVAYLLNEQPGPAEAACRQALAHSADHVPAWRNLALACLRQGRAQAGVSILAAVVQAHPADVPALLMLARCYMDAAQAASARFLYERVLALEPQQAEALAGIAALPASTPASTPAATAPLNRLARPEHSDKLARLAGLKLARAKTPVPTANLAAAEPAPLAVALYGPTDVTLGIRVGVPASALHQLGHRVSAGALPAAGAEPGYAVYVFSRPQLMAGDALAAMADCRAAGAQVVVDLDDDFHHLPREHPGYDHVGPGNPANLRLLESALAQADLVTVATPVLAEAYAPFAERVLVLPNGWDQSNTLWDRPLARRHTVNIGWAGTLTHRADFAVIRSALTRLVRDVPEVQVVIGGDPEIYESLSAIPENRRLYLPMVSYEDYPYLLAHFDVLLAPLQDQPFNRSKSDIKLLEAGIRRIPWVASPRPAYLAWNVGGLLAETPDEWYAALRQLAGDADLRRSLGSAGRRQAETRESRQLGPAWQAALATLGASAKTGRGQTLAHLANI